MTYEKQIEIAKEKRQLLIDALVGTGCTPYDAASFAIEEYFMGCEFTDYSYHEYHEHYVKRHLNDNGTPRFGHLMTQVLDRFFYEDLSKKYMAIKTAVYNKMDELKESDELWSMEYIANFEDWCALHAESFIGDCEEDEEGLAVVDFDWNLLNEDIIV